MKRFLFIFFLIISLIQSSMGFTFADSQKSSNNTIGDASNQATEILTGSKLGPFGTEKDLEALRSSSKGTALVIETVYSWSEFESVLYYNMVNRVSNFTIQYYGSTADINTQLNIIFNNALNIDDYLHYNFSGAQWDGNYSSDYANITYNVSYLTSLAEEQYVTDKVNTILSQIITSDMNIDEKERAIHDYIVANVKYDETLTEHSAYAALMKGTTVCQGYTLLAYKMLEQVGINTIIVGSNEMNHAWNMVNIRGNWYHLDCTWDDPLPDVQGRVLHNYYNLSDAQMEQDHIWDRSIYPAAPLTYMYTPYSVKADLNTDGVVDMLDVNLILSYYGLTTEDSAYSSSMDIFQDGVIDIYDLVLVTKYVH